MRFSKTLGVAACAAFAFLATFGATSAMASHEVKSCEGAANCKPTTIGSTTVFGGAITMKNFFINNTCNTYGISAEITDNKSTGGTDPINMSIFEALFNECTYATTPEKLEWGLTTNHNEFPNGSLSGVQVTFNVGGAIGNCTFAEDATHVVTFEWVNGTPSKMKLGGTMKRTAGVSGCGAEVSVSGTITLTALFDPNYAAANNLRIE